MGDDGSLRSISIEYLPPRDISVTAAGTLLKLYNPEKVLGSIAVAQILDLAIRGYLKIYSLGDDKYQLKIMKDLRDLKPEEFEVFEDMLDRKVFSGDVIDIGNAKRSIYFVYNLADNLKKYKKSLCIDYGMIYGPEYDENLTKIEKFYKSLTGVSRITPKGQETRRYLLGLMEYIRVAEKVRIDVLHTKEALEKLAEAGLSNEKELVIKEKLLPYAVIFGFGESWSKLISDEYSSQRQEIAWYAGTSGLNFKNFSDATVTSFSNPSSSRVSSRTGGSSGMGFSGGGGGGGGGGGR